MFYDDYSLHQFKTLTSKSFTESIHEDFFNDGCLPDRCQWFDKEGFELTELENLYATANHLPLTNKAFGHRAIGWRWIENTDIYHPDIYVDHSYIVYRPAFAGEAKEQIERYVKRYPFLTKLLKIKSKVGIDVALEYVTEALTTEVLHIEIDKRDLTPVWLVLRKIQAELKYKDWNEVIETIKALQPNIEDLPSDDQSDIKARAFGFGRTYETLKTV